MKLIAYRRQIEAALVFSGQSHTFEDIDEMVDEGRAQAWYGPESIIITEIVIEPRQKVLHYFLAGGNLAELEAMYPIVEEFGRREGCTRATIIGRKGWERTFLKPQGWESKLVVLEKGL